MQRMRTVLQHVGPNHLGFVLQCADFIRKKSLWKMRDCISEQMEAIRRGFSLVLRCAPSLLSLLACSSSSCSCCSSCLCSCCSSC